jgi:hypothetical protein
MSASTSCKSHFAQYISIQIKMSQNNASTRQDKASKQFAYEKIDTPPYPFYAVYECPMPKPDSVKVDHRISSKYSREASLALRPCQS